MYTKISLTLSMVLLVGMFATAGSASEEGRRNTALALGILGDILGANGSYEAAGLASIASGVAYFNADARRDEDRRYGYPGYYDNRYRDDRYRDREPRRWEPYRGPDYGRYGYGYGYGYNDDRCRDDYSYRRGPLPDRGRELYHDDPYRYGSPRSGGGHFEYWTW